MAEHLLGFMSNVVVAERLGRSLAAAALAEELDGAMERQRRERRRKRRARMAKALRALAMRLAPGDARPVPGQRPLPAGQ